MITRRWFATAADAEAPWERAARAPADARPLRIARSIVLSDEPGTPPGDVPGDVLGTAWFADTTHLARFDRWLGSGGPETLAAHEVVVRGAEWLERRWAAGGARYTHVALAHRHPTLDRHTFSSRWRDHAGRVGTAAIPEHARGLAYVQSHPLLDADAPPYDAITEVWFENLDALRARIAWLADALADAPPDDLFGERHLFAAREELLLTR